MGMNYIFGMAARPFPCNYIVLIQGNLPWHPNVHFEISKSTLFYALKTLPFPAMITLLVLLKKHEQIECHQLPI